MCAYSMNSQTIIIIIFSVLALIYVLTFLKSRKRLHLIVELFFILFFLGVILIALFPSLAKFFETLLGVNSIVQFITYTSILFAYFIIFMLYQKSETQRVEITKLTREIALLRKNEKKSKK